MFELSNVMRDYAWGSPTAIAELLGTRPSGGPEAELWMGAHPDSPSTAATPEGPVALDALIAANPEAMLGADVAARFDGRLPFLTKLLAAETALSLQVHPTLERARAGFAREEAAGVPHGAAHRNYKDGNHKPEMIFALTDFHALCGFRPADSAAQLFDAVARAIEAAGSPVPPLLARVSAALRASAGNAALHPAGGASGGREDAGIRSAFEALIGGGAEASALVELAAAALANTPLAGTPLADTPLADTPATAVGGTNAALRTVVELERQYPGDPGILISLLLNRISLAPGEAVCLPAGNIHAYLSGLGLEVMASSDNVMRGGLTGKHVDVPELLETVEFAATDVPYVPTRTTELGQHVWEPPFAEFALQRVELAPGDEPVPLVQNGPLLVLAVAGRVLLDSPRGDRELARGGSVFVPAAENPVLVHPHTGDGAGPAVVFAVTVAGSLPTA